MPDRKEDFLKVYNLLLRYWKSRTNRLTRVPINAEVDYVSTKMRISRTKAFRLIRKVYSIQLGG